MENFFDFATIGASLVAIITAIIALKKSKSEIKVNESDAAGKITIAAGSISDSATELMNKALERYEEICKEMKEVNARLRDQDNRITRLEYLFKEMFDGAKKLFAQIESLGQIPLFNPKDTWKKYLDDCERDLLNK